MDLKKQNATDQLIAYRVGFIKEVGERVVVCVPDGRKYRVLISVDDVDGEIVATVHSSIGRPKKIILIEKEE